MEPAPKPDDELERLAALYTLDVLDTASSEPIERFTRLARRIFHVPFALVTFIDAERQWVMSGFGGPCDLPRSTSFCGYAILGPDVMTVDDTKEDPRFVGSPFVENEPSVRAYAGAPLTIGGHRVGTICLLDDKPHQFSEDEREILRDLASSVESEFASARLAVVDELTGLYNRRGFVRAAEQFSRLAERQGETLTVFAFDVDGLKVVNDRGGHAAGDAVIRTAGDLLRATFRESDTVARVGGDEFGALVYGECDADAVMARVAKATAGAAPLRLSGGWASSEGRTGESLVGLLALADARMYEDKQVRRDGTRPD